MKEKENNFGLPKRTVYVDGELERFGKEGILKFHAYPDHYMPLYNFIKTKWPNTLLLACDDVQFIFKRSKVKDVWKQINEEKNKAAEQLQQATQTMLHMADLMEKENISI